MAKNIIDENHIELRNISLETFLMKGIGSNIIATITIYGTGTYYGKGNEIILKLYKN